jgi:hypothetical protein
VAPLLGWLHFALLPIVRQFTGQMLVPSNAWYNFYPINDAIWLHIDVAESDLVVVSTALGEVGALHLHPTLQGADQTELDSIRTAPEWDERSGVRVPYPRRGILIQRGRKLPHHRPGHELPVPSAVLALHYRSLWTAPSRQVSQE